MGSLCAAVWWRGGVGTLGHGLLGGGDSHGVHRQLYRLVVKEREKDGRNENWNKMSLMKVTRSFSKRWRRYEAGKVDVMKNKEEKQSLFSLDFYFSDKDSIYCSLCPNDWNPLEFSGDFCASEANFSGISIKNPLRKISKYFNKVYTKSRSIRRNVKNAIRNTSYIKDERSSSSRDSGICSSQDVVDDITTVSISSSFTIFPSPPPTFKSDISHTPIRTASLLLPSKIPEEDLFGPHLQLETVQTVVVPPVEKEDISSQQRNILSMARLQMEEIFPYMSCTINILFSGNLDIIIRTISSSTIGDLIFQIKTILFSPLFITMQFIDITLSVIIRFLNRVSFLLFPSFSSPMVEKMARVMNEECREVCVEVIRSGFVDIWCTALALETQ